MSITKIYNAEIYCENGKYYFDENFLDISRIDNEFLQTLIQRLGLKLFSEYSQRIDGYPPNLIDYGGI